VSLEADSNVNEEMEEPEKHSLQRASIEDGRQSDFNSTQSQNALLSILVRLESDSNVNKEMEVPEKDFSARTPTEHGMQIDFKAEQPQNT
jgi:hypothetical protein